MSRNRKRDHLQICLQEDTRSCQSTGLERYRLAHCALPELDRSDVDTTTRFLGHEMSVPLLFSAMTGGVDEASEINRNLARVAQELGLAMGLGSQRAALERPELLATYQVRDIAPDILLFANLGAVQLAEGYSAEQCARLVDAVGADALVLHLNPLQEALQPEGDTHFRGLLARIASVCRALDVPVIAKEVGWGISAEVAVRLQACGIAAIDVAGAGGTSWAKVEAQRCDDWREQQVASAFTDWGIPTADALVAVHGRLPDMPLIASGGVRSGVQVAKCLALGADLVGLAGPLLAPASESPQALHDAVWIIRRQLEIAMFCCGRVDIARLDSSCLRQRIAQ